MTTDVDIGFGTVVIVFVVGVVLTLAGFHVLAFADSLDAPHKYEVKAEQVADASTVENASDVTRASDEERELLFDAFKKEDHLFGEASADLRVRGTLDDIRTDRWMVVEASGVPILMVISGPDKLMFSYITELIIAFSIGGILTGFGLLLTVSLLAEGYDRIKGWIW